MTEISNNFDHLLDQALAEFASAQKTDSPDSRKDYQEYAEFLQEISDADEELARAEISAVADIEDTKEDEETNELFDDIKNDTRGWYNKSEWVVDEKGEFVRQDGGEMFSIEDDNIVSVSDTPLKKEPGLTADARRIERAQQLVESARKWRINRDLRKIEINRMAFDQKILPLNAVIPVEHKRLVIELLTKPLRQLIVKYADYINNRVTKLLAPAIPAPVKLAAVKWPWIFITNPGFLYKTHPHFGEVKTFWVNPKLPYFFKQGTEQVILEERDASLAPYFLDCIDRAVHRWYSARENLAKREVMYASRMIGIKGNTYYHLLLLNPFWFEKLYNHVKETRANSDELM